MTDAWVGKGRVLGMEEISEGVFLNSMTDAWVGKGRVLEQALLVSGSPSYPE